MSNLKTPRGAWRFHITQNTRLQNSLELPTMLFGPALDHNFLVGVELDRIATLSMQIAEEAVLPSAEWKIRHRRGNSDIDPNVAGWSLVAEPSGRRSARGK